MLHRILNTKWGMKAVQHYLYQHPQAVGEAVRKWSNLNSRLPNCDVPSEVHGFEDLVFLFHLSKANYGVCLMELDEAACMYSLVKSLGKSRIAEVGRYKGGSTVIMAAAHEGEFDSYDNHCPCEYYDGYGKTQKVEAEIYDEELKPVLEKLGLKVNLHFCNSHDIKPEGMYDLVFIDADHSYEGAKKDYLIWEPHIREGGYIVLHDAVNTRKISKCKTGVIQLAEEIPNRIKEVGSMVVFQK